MRLVGNGCEIMKTRIFKGRAAGEIAAPPSKSAAHRLLACSFLSGEACEISNVDLSQDIKATLGCVRALGGDFSINGDSVAFMPSNRFRDRSYVGDRASATGQADAGERDGEFVLDCLESATTLRLFIPIALVLKPGRKIVMRGSEKLISRGLSAYEELFRINRIDYSKSADSFSFCGSLPDRSVCVDGSLSSQYASGLMLAFCADGRGGTITIKGKPESLPYIRMTADVMSGFGVDCVLDGNVIIVPALQRLRGVNARVEGDYSNAAFFEALNYLNGENSVRVTGLAEETFQADASYGRLFPMLRDGAPRICISDCIDLGPILFSLAAALNGAALTGIRRLRIKECDRAECMAMELAKFGSGIELSDNEAVISASALHAPKEILLGHNDHRVVMALAILLTRFGGVIDGTEAVSKSFPSFFEALGRLGIRYEHFN